jgi:hypothetical protein
MYPLGGTLGMFCILKMEYERKIIEKINPSIKSSTVKNFLTILTTYDTLDNFRTDYRELEINIKN